MRFSLIILISLAIVSNAAVTEVRTAKPVFFSYAWPIGPETYRDFTTLDMDEINVIDVGPDSLSYPPSIRNHYPPGILEKWRAEGITLVRRCYDRPFGENNRKIPLDEVTVEQLVERWSHSMEDPRIDGITIDEFIKNDTGIVAVWIEALGLIRKRYPDKLIFCWIAGKGLQVPDLHRAIRDNADYCMPEIYYRESAAEGFPDFGFPRFREAVDILEKNAPGISNKLLIGLGVHEKIYNDDPKINFSEFLEAQISLITSDPVMKNIPGLAFYTPARLTQGRIAFLDALLRKYYPNR